MADHVEPTTRSWIMSRVKSQNTSPELYVRKILHAAGFRFRLNRNDLPGKPDLVLPRYKTAVFVHGCFWHGHQCKRGGRIPKTNTAYWRGKIKRTVERDRMNLDKLVQLGWKPHVIWECKLQQQTECLVKALASEMSQDT